MFNFFHKTVVYSLVCWYSLTWVHAKQVGTGWTGKEADIYFLIDSSASIWFMDYIKMLQFVADLVSDMDIRSSAVRVGVGVFSSHHKLYLHVNNTLSKHRLRQEILGAPFLKGDTFLSRALKGLREDGLPPNSSRPGATRIAVLLTDGMSRYKQLTSDNATLAKQDGIFLYTIGIGSGVDVAELHEIASDPQKEFSYHVSSFDNLKNIRAQLSHRMSEVGMQGDQGTCGAKEKVDVVFVFDQAAFGDLATQHIRSFIAEVVKEFSMNTGNVRVGVVASTCLEVDQMLGQHFSREDFISGLQATHVPDVGSLVKRALREAFLSRNGGRYDAKHRMVLLLHHEGRKHIEIVRQVSRSKHVGIEVFVIQIGTNYDKDFVNRLASSEENIMYLDSSRNLTTTVEQKNFNRMFCRDL
ncbi:hypothetical protein BsWGS_04801 [Bradybaena similaris]